MFAVALVARLVALPFSTFDSGDSASRVWLAWEWLDHPFLITDGIWGPLHFYLIGAMLYLWPDPVWTPIVLHVILGALVPVVVYFMTLEMFGDRRAAFVTGLAFAVYPTAIAISLLPRSETPFLLFLGLALLFLARARRPERRLRDAVLAGVALGLASMLRYEAWFLMPFLTAILVDRPRQAAAFLVPALIHPAIWMVGSTLAHGDPFYSIDWGSRWNQEAMGYARQSSVYAFLSTMWNFIRTTQSGLSVPLSLAIATGVITCLVHRRRAALWLIPPAGLFLMLVAAAARGSLLVKWQYTATFGLLLVPYIACALNVLGSERWSVRRYVLLSAGLILAIAVCTIEPLWRAIPGARGLYAPAVARFANEDAAHAVQHLLTTAHLQGNDALVSDFYGWLPTGYVALHTKLHPKRICMANGAPNLPVGVGGVKNFLRENPHGIIITREHGRLTSHIRFQSDGTAELDELNLALQPLGTVPLTGDGRKSAGDGTVTVARYALVSAPRAGNTPPQRCVTPCTIELVESCSQ